MTPLPARRPETLRDLEAIAFDNTFVRELPADPVGANVPRQVAGACYTRVSPTPVAAPRLVAWSDDLGQFLGLRRPASPDVFSGNRVLPGMAPYAARYGGHQFGHWAGQLGDGRAITLAEMIASDGSRQELQLKGAGLTPYSRTADGRAVLRSSLREFLCSEAMSWLGVPTTRALSLVATGEAVIRDMFYDGNPRPEPGAIVCRVAPSFVRFGNFQVLEPDVLKQLADYVIRHHFAGHDYVAFYREVCRRTAALMVDWMRLGFVHGVMNTDNLSILGLTIDYGPYGWLEGYDPAWTPNTTDAQGRRYCYGNQPYIAQWNLARLAEALMPLIPETAPLEDGLKLYAETFQAGWQRALAQKVGLVSLDDQMAKELFEALGEAETDFTLFFRNLARIPLEGSAEETLGVLGAAFYSEAERPKLAAWLRGYVAAVKQEGVALHTRVERMDAVNPKYVFRNYLAVQAIDAAAQGDAGPLERLMKVLARPYDEQPEHHDLAARRPEWARHKAGCSALSCSS
jgi:uncharacterized protein YdiU (UPF0061 family)